MFIEHRNKQAKKNNFSTSWRGTLYTCPKVARPAAAKAYTKESTRTAHLGLIRLAEASARLRLFPVPTSPFGAAEPPVISEFGNNFRYRRRLLRRCHSGHCILCSFNTTHKVSPPARFRAALRLDCGGELVGHQVQLLFNAARITWDISDPALYMMTPRIPRLSRFRICKPRLQPCSAGMPLRTCRHDNAAQHNTAAKCGADTSRVRTC